MARTPAPHADHASPTRRLCLRFTPVRVLVYVRRYVGPAFAALQTACHATGLQARRAGILLTTTFTPNLADHGFIRSAPIRTTAVTVHHSDFQATSLRKPK